MRGTVGQQSNPEWLDEVLNSTNSERKVQLTARLTRSQYSEVQKLVDELGISQAEAIRRLIEKGMGEDIG